MAVTLAVEVMVVMTEVVGVNVGEDEGVKEGVELSVGVIVAVGVSVGLMLGSGEAVGDGVGVLIGTGVFVCDWVLVGKSVEVAVAVGLAVAGESLADATMYGNPIVPNDIRNPVSRRIRTGRRKRADWVIVAPFDPVFFFNYSESKVFVKREGGAVGFYSQPRGSCIAGLTISRREYYFNR